MGTAMLTIMAAFAPCIGTSRTALLRRRLAFTATSIAKPLLQRQWLPCRPWPLRSRDMSPRKQVFKITYPNGKIYVGMDLTGTTTYFGSPSAKERIAADLAEYRLDLTVRKQILWESDTATDAEVRAMEVEFIREQGSNDPALGYNLTPRFPPAALAALPLPTGWYARPECNPLELRVVPRLASWNKADDLDQVRLRTYLDDTEALLADSRIDGPWALRLDVGLAPGRDLLNMADLDNYAYPLAYRLKDSGLVSVWCTKQHSEQSFVRIEPARAMPPPSTDVLVAGTTASASTLAYKEQIHAAVYSAAELPPGPVRLELAFAVSPRRNWMNLWKQTIDSLDPLLGRTYPDRAWNPLDGRITELGMHLTVDPAVRNDVVVGIAAAPA
jgi:hypothetical protein